MNHLLQRRSGIADERYVMLFVVALLVWFALSVPVALLVGRMLAASGRGLEVPGPERPLPRRQHARSSTQMGVSAEAI